MVMPLGVPATGSQLWPESPLPMAKVTVVPLPLAVPVSALYAVVSDLAVLDLAVSYLAVSEAPDPITR